LIFTSFGTSVTPGIPVGTLSGDTLLAIISADSARNVAAPAGWTVLAVQSYTANFTTYTFLRTSDGADVAPTFAIDLGTEPMLGVIARITGYGSHTTISDAQTGTSLTFPANGTAIADTLVYRIFGWDGGPNPSLVMPPTSIHNMGTGSGTNDIWTGISHENVANGQPIGTASATVGSSDNTLLITLAIAAAIAPPVLSLPTAVQTGSTTATGTVTTNVGNGILYYYISANATESSITIKTNGFTQVINISGIQNVNVTGLTASTAYYIHYMHSDVANNDSNVVSSTQFITDAPTRSITNIDTDNDVQAGQSTSITGVVLNLPIVSVTLGGQPLTVTGTPTATNIDVDIPLHIDLQWGQVYQLDVTDTTGLISLAGVTLSSATGWSNITLASLPNTTATDSFFEFAQTDSIVGNFTAIVGDVLVFQDSIGLTVNDQTIPTIDPPSTVFGEYKFWSTSLGGYTPLSSYTFEDAGSVASGTQVTSSLGSILLKQNILRNAVLDSLLLKVGIPVSTSIDSVLSNVNSVVAIIDSILVTSGTSVSTNLDSLLKKTDIQKLVTLSAILQSQNNFISSNMNAILTSNNFVNSNINSILQKMVTVSSVFDTFLVSTRYYCYCRYKCYFGTNTKYNCFIRCFITSISVVIR